MRDKVGKPGWKLAGGNMEPGESLVDTVVREAREEVGLTVVPGRIIGWKDFYRTNGASKEYHVRIFFEGATDTDVLVIDPDEVAEARWFTVEELKKMSLEELYADHREAIRGVLRSIPK